MWSTVNQFSNFLFDLLLWPFSGLSPEWQILVLAVPATIISLLVFKYSSNQEGIKRNKDKIKAYLLEMRLFKDDLGVTLGAEKKILRHTAAYLGHALLPMAVMIIPFILILVQVESRFAFKSLDIGKQVILSVTLDSETSIYEFKSTLKLPDGLVNETPAMRLDDSKEILWRIRAQKAGTYKAVVTIDDQIVEKQLVIDEGALPLSPTVYRANDIRSIGYPIEPALDENLTVSEIDVTYPRARAEFAGLSSASWLLVLYTLVLGFVMRGFFGVTF